MRFFTRYKKIFLIIGFLGIVIAIGYLIWHIFFKTPEIIPIQKINPGTISGFPQVGSSTTPIKNSTGTSGLPNQKGLENIPNPNEAQSLALGGLTKTKTLTNSPSLNPTLSPGGGVQYYDNNNGHFYRIDNKGQKTLLSSKTFYNVSKVVWAPNKNKAILEYPDGTKTLYNFQTQKQVTLPSHWADSTFSPDSNKLISKSLGLDPENHWLVVSNDDGSQAKALEYIGNNDKTVYPDWSPNNQIVATYTRGLDFNRQEIYFVGLHGENFKSTVIEGRGLQSKWSKSGDRLLYSVYNSSTNLNPRLWIVNAQGDNISKDRHNLSLATWAKKCTFASNTEIYCAVPENLPEGAGLFPELADKTKDDLYKIDLATGRQELIAVPNGAFNISSVLVPENSDNLYFTDKTTKKIYQIKLH